MKSIKTQEHIKNLILQIEDKWAVDSWMVNGVHIWPYVRIKLYIHLLSSLHENSTEQNFTNTIKIKKTFNLGSKIVTILKLIRSFFRLPLFFLALKRKKIMFYGAHYHRVLQDGNYFNRFYDAMVDYHKLHEDVYMVEYTTVYGSIYNKNAIIDLNKYLNDYKLLFKFFNRFKQSTNTVSLDGYTEFYKNLEGIQIDLNSLRISEVNIIKWAIKINSIEGFFIKMYKKIKPSKIFFLGYYGLDNLYAALVAANKLDINTIDFQHGPQTNVHMAFSSWTKVPLYGYNTMPLKFWSWDKKSKENIDEWANLTNNTKSKFVGQPYISYWLKKHNNIKSKNKIILYSLQTAPIFSVEEMLTPKIISLIKKSDYKWILRLHPRNNIDLVYLKEYIKSNGIFEHTIIQDAIEVSLPNMLNSTILHITNFSGCLIEAQLMGISTLLIHEIGKEIFKEYIDDKLVFFSNKDSTTFEKKFHTLIKKVEKDRIHTKSIEIVNPLL
ncbi:hypothetical protein Lupro_02295 [Lutibacter profundi]|uniref:Uncharacterized protein n=1 Tax=Lutibacter profundi TaxID=1622118 RepID=A0A120IE04_9FLAO|nr:hypothetical protein [Lutibacter profundi]AMC10149.1 hypothetical protein Lupro_02295 [Lutibacter profundi]